MSRFTKISPRRMGAPRFGGEKESAPVNGPVVTYRLSPEEVAARYGQPNKNKTRFKREKLTKENLSEFLKTKTVGQIALCHNVPQKMIFELVEKYDLKLDDKNRLIPGGDDMGYGDKIRAAKETLKPAEFEEFVRQGMTDREVADASGLELHMIKKLKQAYNLIGINSRGRKPKKQEELVNVNDSNNGAEQSGMEEEACCPLKQEDRKITISQAIEFREELLNELACVEEILKPDTNLAPKLKKLLHTHLEECGNQLKSIEEAFENTEIAI